MSRISIGRFHLFSWLILVATFCHAVQPARAGASEIIFSVIPGENSNAQKARWGEFLDDFVKVTGLSIKSYFANDYGGVIEAMRFNKVQLAIFGTASAIPAVDRAQAEIFASITNARGEAGYYSVLVTHRDSGIETLADLLARPGKYTLGTGDPNSTSGFLVPNYELWAKNHIDVRRHFTRVVNFSHETDFIAVSNRQVDVATISTSMIERVAQTQPEKLTLIRELWRSALIPQSVITYRRDLDPVVKEKIRQFFLNYGTDRPGADVAAERAIISKMGSIGGFIAANDTHLLPVRKIILLRDRMKIEQDEYVTATDRGKNLAEIDAKLARLQSEMMAASND